MSDGITDTNRDSERATDYQHFLICLADFLEIQTQISFMGVMSAAEKTDAVPRGLMSGKTNLLKNLDDLVKKLLEKDERAWIKLLLSACNLYPATVFERLKLLSPFKDKIIVLANFGFGFVSWEGELESALVHIITRNGLKTYDADQYAIVIEGSALKDAARVVWLSCGVSGVKGPRSVNEPSFRDSFDFDD